MEVIKFYLVIFSIFVLTFDSNESSNVSDHNTHLTPGDQQGNSFIDNFDFAFCISIQ